MEWIHTARDRALALTVPWLVALVVTSFALQRVTQAMLDDFYERSRFPVPYYVGQLSFSSAELEGWYAYMYRAGTLGIYRQTQVVDFAFIAATAALFFWALTLLARSFPADSRGRRVATALIPLGLLGPLCDVAENLVSFVLLARPEAISELGAVAHSAFAAAKFASFAAVYVWLLAGFVLAAVVRWRLTRSGSGPVTTSSSAASRARSQDRPWS